MLTQSILTVILSLLIMKTLATLAFHMDINSRQRDIILSSIDNSADPCEDFYTHACGNYAKLHRSPNYLEITSWMDHQYNVNVANLLNTLYQHDHQVNARCQSFVEKTRVYLKACHQETTRNLTRYFEDLKPAEQLDWPILQNQAATNTKLYQWPDDRSFDIWSLLGNLQSYGLNNVLLNQEFVLDSNGSISIMLEPAFTKNNSTLPELLILHVLLTALGVQEPPRIIEDLLKTDQVLLSILEEHDNTAEEIIEITYQQFQLQYPNLVVFLRELFRQQLPPESLIQLRNSAYFQHINALGNQQSLTKEQWCNYLMMQFLFFLANDSTSDFNTMACVKDLRNKMDLSVNYLYYYHNYSQKAQHYNSAVYEIFKNIIDMMSKHFHKNHLNLTEPELQTLKDKLNQVRLNIGNLPDNPTFDKIEQFYENIPALDKQNYYKNHLLLLRHRFDKSLHYAPQQTHYIVSDNRMGSLSGAFYLPKQNMIVLPFGSLAQPLYDVGYHELYQYSLLGFIMAHELAHAFDITSLNVDGMGNTLEDGNSILDNDKFQDSLQCLNMQLETESLDERIADIVAIDIIYKIYITKFNNMTHDSIKSTWKQDFYYNLAQFFCGKSNLRFIDHDTDAQRLNQIVLNSEGFAVAFRCKANSTMNPSERCTMY